MSADNLLTRSGERWLAALKDGTDSDRNPFILQDGKILLRHDEIRFATSDTGVVTLTLRWKGEDIWQLQKNGFQIGDQIGLSGIKGTMEVQIG